MLTAAAAVAVILFLWITATYGGYLISSRQARKERTPVRAMIRTEAPGREPRYAPGPCGHDGAVAVDSVVTGEILAWWCPDCETRLDRRPEALALRWAQKNTELRMLDERIRAWAGWADARRPQEQLLRLRIRRQELWNELEKLTEELNGE